MNHFLISLAAFLGPVEELQERLETMDLHNTMLQMSLKTLEDEGEWIVVPEIQFEFTRNAPTVVRLLEDDYVKLLKQFNIKSIYTSILDYYLNAFRTGKGDISLMTCISISCHLVGILERCCFTLPHSFTSFFLLIAQHLIVINQFFVNAIQPLVSSHRGQYIILSTPGSQVLHKTSIMLETDAFISRTVALFLRVPLLGWKILLSLPFNIISPAGKLRLLNDILNCEFLKEKNGNEVLVEFLITVGSEAANFFPVLLALSLQENISDAIFLKCCRKIIGAAFSLCLCNSDLRSVLLPSVTRVLVAITTLSPHLLSYILSQTRSNFESLSFVIVQLFKSLPTKLWIPALADIQILEGMLNDPVNSEKSKLALYVIMQLPWEVMVCLYLI